MHENVVSIDVCVCYLAYPHWKDWGGHNNRNIFQKLDKPQRLK